MRRPLVTLSYAQTLDGRLATRSGSSQWISGAESLRFSHALRAASDALMVGVGTVLADDPRLTVRLVPGTDPLRVIVDSRLRLPDNAAVLRDGAAVGTLIACTSAAPQERRAQLAKRGVTLVETPALADGRVDLAHLLAILAERGIATLMVEGGAQLITSLLRQRLADRLAITVAPKLLGTGIAAVGDLGIEHLDDACLLEGVTLTHAGVDLIIEGQIVYRHVGSAIETGSPS
ncbi:MAG: RibD family protein [Chloroflexia bacterium]|nr:RibD family protein [Chloroflexia bacterium]